MKILFAIATLCAFAGATHASPAKIIKGIPEIEALLASMPVQARDGTVGNALQRIHDIGVKPTAAMKSSIDSRAELDSPEDRIGDVTYFVYTTEPSEQFKRSVCDIAGGVIVLQRRGKFYPQSRGANWILRGDCSTHFPIPKS